MSRISKQLLQTLLKGEISVYELIENQDASLKEFLSICNQLEREGLIYRSQGKIGLTEKGVEHCNSLKLQCYSDIKCPSCQGTGFWLPPSLRDIYERYVSIVKNRPAAQKEYDQGFMDSRDVFRRLGFIYERGEIYGRIFVVGDDDFFSIAAGLTGLPEEIVAVDVDTNVIDFINKTAQEQDLNIKAYNYDVQEEVPEQFRQRFDIFLTDPVETLPGIKLFLSRGVSALKGPESSAYFGLTSLEASRSKWYKIQRILLDMNFVITDIKRQFNTYPDEDKNFLSFQDELPIVQTLGSKIDYDWYKSSFIRAEAISTPYPLIQGEMHIDEQVYKDDESLASPF